jgi:hypothetical protein
VEFDESISQGDIDASSLGAAQESFGPSGFSSDLGSGDSAEDFNSFVTGLTPQQAYTTGRGAKSKALGDNVNNPFPESFFSKLFGAENVDYSNILNTPGGYTPAGINQLRFNQSQNPQNFGMGDFYLGQDTVLGEVKPVPSMMGNIMNFLPGGGILNAFIPQKGLPKFDPRRIAMIEEEQKSANDPTIFDRTSDFVKSILGLDPKDSGASLAASPTGDGQMRVPDTRTFDAFGNVTGSNLDTQDRFKTIEQLSEDRKKQNAINAISDMFQAKPKVQKVADLGQTFRNIRDTTKDVVGPDGVPVFGNENIRFRLGVDPEKQEPKAMFTYNFPTV